jgi:hypothetical protein
VQFRQQETATGAKPRYPPWRGFVTSLTEVPGGDARCTVRVPGVADTVHATASELEPADSLLPVATRTAGVVHHARDAEDTITTLTTWLERNADTVPATTRKGWTTWHGCREPWRPGPAVTPKVSPATFPRVSRTPRGEQTHHPATHPVWLPSRGWPQPGSCKAPHPSGRTTRHPSPDFRTEPSDGPAAPNAPQHPRHQPIDRMEVV